jgi:hypothetical protein
VKAGRAFSLDTAAIFIHSSFEHLFKYRRETK